MNAKDKKTAYIVGGAIILLIGVAYYFYSQGKKKPKYVIPPDDSNPSQLTDGQIQQISEMAHDDLAGFNAFGNHDTDFWTDNVLTLSNTDFVRLYNAFNSKFQPTSAQTFTEWIYNDSYIIFTQWDALRTTLLQRCANLNLP